MLIFPAIDLFEKKVVRLYKGDYAKMTVYSEAPEDVAAQFHASGAQWVHMVDLEGAKDGTTPNFDVVAAVAKNSGLQVEVGGGIRTERVIAQYIDAGVARVILGTAAVTDPDFLFRMREKYEDHIAVGVDIKDGFVATHGWLEKSSVTCNDFCKSLQEMGIKTIICTDISKDGAMRGANHALYRDLSTQFSLQLIASGGVSSMEDVRALRQLDLYGAIVGKAYYTGAINLAEAIEVAR